MTHLNEDLIVVTLDTIGQGDATITGVDATSSYDLPTVIPGNTFYYSGLSDGAGNWETGSGTWLSVGNGTTTFGTFSRNPIKSNNGDGIAANFSGAPVISIQDIPASRQIYIGSDGTVVNGASIAAAVLFPDFASLVAAPAPPVSTQYFIVGHGRTEGDGLGGLFRWRAGDLSAADDHLVETTVNVLQPAIGNGRYIRVRNALKPDLIASDNDLPDHAIGINQATGDLRRKYSANQRGGQGAKLFDGLSAPVATFPTLAALKAQASDFFRQGDLIELRGVITEGDIPLIIGQWQSSSTNTDALDETFVRPDDISGTEPGRFQFVADVSALPAQLVRSVRASDVGGTADAITLTLTGGPVLADGLTIAFVPSAANTGPVTINYNEAGPLALFDGLGEALEADDLSSVGSVFVRYDGAGNAWRLLSGGAGTNDFIDSYVDAGQFDILPENADNTAALTELLNNTAPGQTTRLRRGINNVASPVVLSTKARLSGADSGVNLHRGAQGTAGVLLLLNASSGGLDAERLSISLEQDPFGPSALYFVASVNGDNDYSIRDVRIDGGVTWQPDDTRDSYGALFLIQGDAKSIRIDRCELENLIWILLKDNTQVNRQLDTQVLFSRFNNIDAVPLLLNSPAEESEFRRGLLLGNTVSNVRQVSESFRHGGSLAGYVNEITVGFNFFHGQIGDWFRVEPPAGDSLFIGNFHVPSAGDGGFEGNAGVPSGTGTIADGVPVHSERMVYAFNLTKNETQGVARSGAGFRFRHTTEYITTLKASTLTQYFAQDYASGYEFGPGQETVFVDRAWAIRCATAVTDYYPSLSKDEFILVDSSEIILRRSGVLGKIRMRSLASPAIPQAILIRTSDPALAYPPNTFPPPANADGYAGISGFDYETGDHDLVSGTGRYDLVTGSNMRISGEIEAVLGRVEGQETWGRWTIDFDGTNLEISPISIGSTMITAGSTLISGSPFSLSDLDANGRRTLQLQTFNGTGSAASLTRVQVKFSGFIAVKD